MQEVEAKATEVNERLEALKEVEAWQEERAHLERALAWAPARILRADLEKNANLIDVLGPRELEQARLPRCIPALSACLDAAGMTQAVSHLVLLAALSQMVCLVAAP